MFNQYNFYNLEASFKEYLFAGNANPVSVKNYLSDLRHFFGWLSLYLKSNEIKDTFITVQSINDYKLYLFENDIPHKTINRRLSTIRKFCSFCVDQQILKENPSKNILNVLALPENKSGEVLKEYENNLKLKGTHPNIIINSLNTIQDLLQTI